MKKIIKCKESDFELQQKSSISVLLKDGEREWTQAKKTKCSCRKKMLLQSNQNGTKTRKNYRHQLIFPEQMLQMKFRLKINKQLEAGEMATTIVTTRSLQMGNVEFECVCVCVEWKVLRFQLFVINHDFMVTGVAQHIHPHGRKPNEFNQTASM